MLVQKKGKVFTFEGCPETAKIASNNFNLLSVKNTELLVGPFENMLHDILRNLEKLDFVFFDGNHNLKPTLTYFEQCLNMAHEKSVFVFDDIHWSKNMERAWSQIKAHPKVTISIDLFEMGLVFFRKEQKKQDFVLKY